MSGGVVFGLCFMWCCFGFFALMRYRGLIVEILKDPESRAKKYPQGYNEDEKWHWILVIAGLISFLGVVITCGGGHTVIRIPKALKDFKL